MTPSGLNREQTLWAALLDFQGWSSRDTRSHTQLLHENGTFVFVRYTPLSDTGIETTQHTMRFAVRDPSSTRSVEDSSYDLMEMQLSQDRMSLSLWAEVRAPLIRKDGPRITRMLTSLVLRHDPTAQGSWWGTWDRSSQEITLRPLQEEADPPRLPVIALPSWMRAGPIHMPQWITGHLDEHVHIQSAMGVDLDMPISGHQRLEALSLLSDMPDIQDPASAVYWGLAS